MARYATDEASPSPSQSLVDVAGSLTPFGSTFAPTARDTAVADGTAPSIYDSCVALGGYADISHGTAVTVGGDKGQTLEVGALSAGRVYGGTGNSAECQFSFSVFVPTGQNLYTVTISHRGTQTFTPEQVAQGIDLTLN